MTNSDPLLILVATPKDVEEKIDNFFTENGDIYSLIKDPPHYRYSGWNLLTLDYPKIRGGKAWEVKNGDRKTLRIYEDGTIVAICPADNSFLGWGKDYDEFSETPNLNTLAVVEYIYEFVRLTKALSKYIKDPNLKITFHMELRNTTLPNGKKLSLIPLKVTDFLYSLREGIHEVDNDFMENIDIKIKEENEKYIAFLLICRFFLHFGIPSNKIPYTSKDEIDRLFIDEKTYLK